jgi:hypothetical protein
MRSAAALDVETLVMPDKVVAGHAEFEAECSACHVAFARERQNSLCVDCHQEIGSDQQAGKGFHGRDSDAKTSECASCHTEHKGRNADIVGFDKNGFDHALTDFALLEKHVDVPCEDCHKPELAYREAATQCLACHLEDDVHKGGLGEDCASCHAPKGWEVVNFAHELETGFALLGGHADVRCDACHIEQSFRNTDSECVACHRKEDVHKGLRGDDCASCHVVADWKESSFDHALKTEFPLTGAHAVVTCERCHTKGTTVIKLESTCISCHRADDVHEGLLGTDCAACHGDADWARHRFKHDVFSDFPLLGDHVDLGCQACHLAPVHESSPGTDCYACHADDDPHAGQLGENCGDCHNETGWTGIVRFEHDFTPFPLIGKHKQADCDDCHETQRFSDASMACVDCHRDDDVHGGGLGDDCASCHSPVDWGRWRFDHFLSAGFLLDGGHADLRCTDCHRSPPKQTGKTSSRCIDCHRNDDVHNGQFGKDCGRCHSTATFTGAER